MEHFDAVIVQQDTWINRIYRQHLRSVRGHTPLEAVSDLNSLNLLQEFYVIKSEFFAI